MRNTTNTSIEGFTVIELFITIAILSLIVAIGGPQLREAIQINRMAAASNSVVHAMNLARIEAIKRGTLVKVSSISGTTDWSTGINISIDDAVFKRIEAAEGDLLLKATSGTSVTFQADGFLRSTGDTFTICPVDGGAGRQITLAKSGRVSLDEDYTCS